MKTAALPLAFAFLLLPSCSQDPLAGLSAFQGEWAGTHKILGEEGEHAASYSVRRDGDELIWEFQSGFQGGFTGRARQRWDAASGELVETWTDSTAPDAPMEIRGSFDAQTGVMLMKGMAPDWSTGAQVEYQHETTRIARDEWKYVMRQQQAGGEFVEVMWIHMRRK
jgi:hypothetical protein